MFMTAANLSRGVITEAANHGDRAMTRLGRR